MNTQPLLSLVIGLIVINLGLGLVCLYLSKKLGRLKTVLGTGNDIENLEEIIEAISVRLKHLDASQKDLKISLEQVKLQLAQSVQKVGVHRFNALQDEGGNLSFTIAILNEHNSGVVMTSIHNRNQTRIFTKTIEAGEGASPLTEEEVAAIAIAYKQYQTPKLQRSIN